MDAMEYTKILTNTISYSSNTVHSMYNGTLKIQLESVHSLSIKNKTAIEKRKQMCGCFNCLSIFPSEEIEDWISEPDGNYTALCPHCCTDSVIYEDAGYPITIDFLQKMHERWM